MSNFNYEAQEIAKAIGRGGAGIAKDYSSGWGGGGDAVNLKRVSAVYPRQVAYRARGSEPANANAVGSGGGTLVSQPDFSNL